MGAFPGARALADESDKAGTSAECTVYNRARGECSIGTDAPSRETMLNAIKSGSPTKLMGTLEYGERVECDACVQPLVDRILKDDNADVREFAAWWLRRRTFHIGYAMTQMRTILADDADPVRRARAASAMGEFLDGHALPHLTDAVTEDKSADVRAAAVSALGRLNHPGGVTVIADAFADDDKAVRLAALKAVRRVNFFNKFDELIGALGDDDGDVRKEASLLAGQYRVEDAVPVLAGILRSDKDTAARRAAAWSLGRIGGADAGDALKAARKSETDSTVRDAVDVALQM